MSGESPDAFEELRRANPVPPASVTYLGHSTRADATLRSVLETPAQSRRWTPWWRRRRVVIPVVIAVGLASAAAGYALSRPVRQPLQVACYLAPRTTALAVIVSSTGASPAAACQPAWHHGPLGHTGAPPLFTCVLASGSVAVFPSRTGSPCARLGLASPVGSPVPPAALEELQRVLRHDEVAASGCLQINVARVEAEEAIRSNGIHGWHVVIGTATPRGPHCAGYGIDPVRRVVHVVPQPRT